MMRRKICLRRKEAKKKNRRKGDGRRASRKRRKREGEREGGGGGGGSGLTCWQNPKSAVFVVPAEDDVRRKERERQRERERERHDSKAQQGREGAIHNNKQPRRTKTQISPQGKGRRKGGQEEGRRR